MPFCSFINIGSLLDFSFLFFLIFYFFFFVHFIPPNLMSHS
jgi:hypothetical protein